jgi:hypothetical protein
MDFGREVIYVKQLNNRRDSRMILRRERFLQNNDSQTIGFRHFRRETG